MGKPREPCWQEFSPAPLDTTHRQLDMDDESDAYSTGMSDAPGIRTKSCPDMLCNHCNEVVTNAQPARKLLPHLRNCIGLTPEQRAEWQYGGVKCPEKRSVGTTSSQATYSTPRKSRRVTSSSPSSTRRQGLGSPMTPMRPPAPTKRLPLSKEEEEEWHYQVALPFYTASLPYQLIDNVHFRRMLLRDREHLTLPSRAKIASTLLEVAFTREQQAVVAALKTQQRLALVSDGWTNTNSEGIINFVVCSPTLRPMFWTSISAEDNAHTAEYMADKILSIIAEIEKATGLKVSSVVTDNAANMKAMWDRVRAKHPKMICNGCAAHTINLMLKDAFKIEMFAEVLTKAAMVVRFVRKRQSLLARFRKEQRVRHHAKTKRRALCTPVATRWYASVSCIKSVVHNRDLINTVLDDSDLRDRVRSIKLDTVLTIMADATFWSNAAITLKIMAPMTRSLAVMERDSCCLSMVYHHFKLLRECKVYVDPMPGLHTDIQKSIRTIVSDRWDFIKSKSLFVSYLLDPSKLTTSFANGDYSIATDYCEEMLMTTAGVTEPSFVYEDAVFKFVNAKDGWSAEEQDKHARKVPINWWSPRSEMQLMRQLALQIFSVPTSSAASERSWSIMGHIHSKIRNRLTVESVKKLAYIYSNQGDKTSKKVPYHGQYPLSDTEPETVSDVDSELLG